MNPNQLTLKPFPADLWDKIKSYDYESKVEKWRSEKRTRASQKGWKKRKSNNNQ